jgi:V/A-type H+-transporting ATPase subunit E
MEAKIKELTEKLYQEGVEKGEAEATRLIEDAQNRRKILLEEAQNEAKEIVSKATKQAEDLRKNTESELKLYASQSLSALSSEVANMITGKLAEEAVKSAFQKENFMADLIVKLISEWHGKENLTISTQDAEALKNYFNTKAKALLDKGITLEQINGKKHSFTIAPADGSYKINFGEEEFIEYFKEFLRPQLIDLLF